MEDEAGAAVVAWVQETGPTDGELRLDLAQGPGGKLQILSHRWTGDVVLLRDD